MLSISSGWSYQSHLRNIEVYLICRFFALFPLALERSEQQCFNTQQRVRAFLPRWCFMASPETQTPLLSAEVCYQSFACSNPALPAPASAGISKMWCRFCPWDTVAKPPKDCFCCSVTFSCGKKSQTIEYYAPDRKHEVLQMENTENVFVTMPALHTLLDSGIWCLQLDFHKCRLLGQTRWWARQKVV